MRTNLDDKFLLLAFAQKERGEIQNSNVVLKKQLYKPKHSVKQEESQNEFTKWHDSFYFGTTM
jgi:hypothetical protein